MDPRLLETARRSEVDRAIIRSVAALAQDLGRELVTPAVDDPETAALARTLGCIEQEGAAHFVPQGIEGTVRTLLDHAGRDLADATLMHARRTLEAVAPYAEVDRPALDTDELRLLRHEEASLLLALRTAIDAGDTELAMGLAGAARFYLSAGGSIDEAVGLLSTVLGMPGSQAANFDRARLAWLLARIEFSRGQAESARSHVTEAARIFQSIGDTVGYARCLTNLGVLQVHLKELAPAIGNFEEALKLRQAAGDRAGVARTLNNIAAARLMMGEAKTALGLAEEAVAIVLTTRDSSATAVAFSTHGAIAHVLGQSEVARASYRQSLEVFRTIPGLGYVDVLVDVAGLAAENGDDLQALTLRGVIENIAPDQASSALGYDRYRGATDAALARTGQDGQLAVIRGNELGREQAIALAFELLGTPSTRGERRAEPRSGISGRPRR
jgi:tetratricopeptide (TPR) repeat protein